MAAPSPLHLQNRPLHVNLVLLLLAFSAVAVVVTATDHIVGANRGWNPNINYSLWSNNQTFFVGDLISFRYQKNTYNVFEVNRTGYENCTMDGLTGNWSSGKDFIPLGAAKTYYFICGNGFCLNGMRVAVTVRPLAANASASAAPRHGVGAADNSAADGVRVRIWEVVAAAAAIVVFYLSG
ncbi:lamin-like protein [Ananas comosus]|uniref:Lamin-like protein n=2 Tax=Ananas comosus TaxID=4615 RepID=A0A6P5FY78_ANACO|nr:lamin-like protein [Ananas comosus]CAD1823116.1 unnamed protein product [Ananas comosus var. bracteatus]